MKYFLSVPAFLICALLLCPLSAFSCPKINGLIDANCDGKVTVAVFGDSIVRGIRDTGITDENGGYLRILEKSYPEVTFINGGIPGVDSRGLFRAFVTNAPKMGKTYQAIQAADVVLIGVGINDYWAHVPPQMTIRNIMRIRDYVRKFGKKEFNVSPLTMTIALTNTLRGFQQPWVKEMNSLIYANKMGLGPIVPFNKLAARLVVSEDALHPDTLGYKRLATILKKSLNKDYNKLAKQRNIDRDKDGVADWSELQKFGTDFKSKDTDGDGLADGEEIFMYFTDPLKADTDGDGIDDATEIANGTDPLVPDNNI